MQSEISRTELLKRLKIQSTENGIKQDMTSFGEHDDTDNSSSYSGNYKASVLKQKISKLFLLFLISGVTGNIWMSQLATRSRKTRAGKARKIHVISIYLQHLKAEDVQLLEHNYFKSNYCR